MSTILIVEDDPYVRRFYERLFKFNNYDVAFVEFGIEALSKVKEMKPRLVLLDIMMPGMNGLQVLEQLKTDEETKKTLVVMLTNLGDDWTIKKATELGADGFIVKSNVKDEELLATVDAFLGRQQKPAA